MEVIEFNNKIYPKFQAEGNASQFALPYAKHFCKGKGYDIGCNRKEWALPWATPVDLLIDDNDYEAFNLPDEEVDFIYSSHCLEHLENWVDALNYWGTKIKRNGVLFLYLPHYDQEYWRPWNNRKHIHVLEPNIIVDYLSDKYYNILSSGRDLNHSFSVVAQRR
tara:strand:+ start:26560 stop:27051 length:492 start_codon:yes stop_codon:yes gene_type:complete